MSTKSPSVGSFATSPVARSRRSTYSSLARAAAPDDRRLQADLDVGRGKGVDEVLRHARGQRRRPDEQGDLARVLREVECGLARRVATPDDEGPAVLEALRLEPRGAVVDAGRLVGERARSPRAGGTTRRWRERPRRRAPCGSARCPRRNPRRRCRARPPPVSARRSSRTPTPAGRPAGRARLRRRRGRSRGSCGSASSTRPGRRSTRARRRACAGPRRTRTPRPRARPVRHRRRRGRTSTSSGTSTASP